jgi:predicted GIY-YIG superfamily endonuclease
MGPVNGAPGYVYRLYDYRRVLLYVGATIDFGARWKAHLREKSWAAQVRDMTVTRYDSYEEATRAETVAIVAEYPLHNIAGVPAERLYVTSLARLLRNEEIPREAPMEALLWDLARVLAGYLAAVPAQKIPAPGPVPDDFDSRIDPRRLVMRRILADRGKPGYRAGQLVTLLLREGMGAPRETVHAWLRADEADGMVRRAGPPTHVWTWAA